MKNNKRAEHIDAAYKHLVLALSKLSHASKHCRGEQNRFLHEKRQQVSRLAISLLMDDPEPTANCRHEALRRSRT